MEAGTVSRVLLLASVTLIPPAGAGALKVSVQLTGELEFRFTGLHVKDEMAGTVTIALVPTDPNISVPFALVPTELVMDTAVVTAVGASVS
jgi:hypothetical protein